MTSLAKTHRILPVLMGSPFVPTITRCPETMPAERVRQLSATISDRGKRQARTYCQWNAKRRHVGGFRSASMAPSLQHFQARPKPAGHVMVRNSPWSLNTVRDCHTTATRLDVIYFRLLLNRERDVYRHRMVFQRPVSRHTATT